MLYANAAILVWKLGVVQVPATFRPETMSSGGVFGDAVGHEFGKSDF